MQRSCRDVFSFGNLHFLFYKKEKAERKVRGMLVIDAKNAVLGRMAVFAAKKLMAGEIISIINAEQCIITGNPDTIKQYYLSKRKKGSAHHGPYFPKAPHMIVRRTVRGMLPYKKTKGKNALRNLKVYIGIPDAIKDQPENIASRPIRSTYIKLEEISRFLGWRPY